MNAFLKIGLPIILVVSGFILIIILIEIAKQRNSIACLKANNVESTPENTTTPNVYQLRNANTTNTNQQRQQQARASTRSTTSNRNVNRTRNTQTTKFVLSQNNVNSTKSDNLFAVD